MRKLNKQELQEISPGVTVEEIIFSYDGIRLAPFKSSVFTIHPKSISPIDSHQVKECWIVIDGKGVLTCNNKKDVINTKDVIYFDSLETHTVSNPYEEVLKIISIWWE